MINMRSLKRCTRAILLALVLATPVLVSAEVSFKRIVVFGDSLSDPGNAFALRGGTSTPPDYSLDRFLIPSAPFTAGGAGSHHFTNGPTWVEQLARALGLSKSARPAFRDASAGASNYAIGGARARAESEGNFGVQVEAFLADTGGVAPSDALYVIEMGADDLRDALELFLTGRDGNVVLGQALEAIGINIGRLYGAGARKFLVWNLPNVGLTPALSSFGPAAVQFAGFVAQTFNDEALVPSLNSLPLKFPGIDIQVLDVYTKLNEVVEHPANFGLTQVQVPCVTPNVTPFACKNPDEYLFWDGIHPTTAAHGIVAQQAASLLRP
jgi:phospholipase/lecithinase/hemolysin